VIVDEGNFNESSYDSSRLTSIKTPAATPYWAQSHFVKTVGDIHEPLMQNIGEIKFGVAFCEASGVMVRWSGPTSDERSHRVTPSRFSPVKVLNSIKTVPEVCTIRCATANPIEVVIVETEPGRGILRIIDGSKSQDIEMKATSLGVTLWQVGL